MDKCQRLPSSKPDFEAIAENSADVILQVSLDGIAQYASSASLRMFGYRPDEIVGRSAKDFVHPDDLHRIQTAFSSYRSGTSGGEATQFRMRSKDGATIWVEEHARLVTQHNGSDPSSVVIILRDISGMKLLEQRLEALANTDGLTGLLNRRTFDEGAACRVGKDSLGKR
jgi:PAS domain S-box-containing protein